MRAMILLIGTILTTGTGIGVYLGSKLKKDKKAAQAMSVTLKLEKEQRAARNKLRADWAKEHEVLSDNAFAGFKHTPQKIGELTVVCPKCKER